MATRTKNEKQDSLFGKKTDNMKVRPSDLEEIELPSESQPVPEIQKSARKPNHTKGDHMSKNTKTTAIEKTRDFAALQVGDTAKMTELIAENFDGVKITPNDLEVIKVPSGGQLAFEIQENGEPVYVKEFAGIIVNIRTARTMWLKALNDKDRGSANTPPDCFSPDGISGRGDPGGLCSKCELSKFGSADVGEGQKCKEMRLIGILRPGALLPSIVRIPPTSLRNVSEYIRALTQAGHRRIGVVTMFTLKKATSRGGIEYAQVVLATKTENILDDNELQLVASFADTMKSVIDGFGRSAEHFTDETDTTETQ